MVSILPTIRKFFHELQPDLFKTQEKHIQTITELLETIQLDKEVSEEEQNTCHSVKTSIFLMMNPEFYRIADGSNFLFISTMLTAYEMAVVKLFTETLKTKTLIKYSEEIREKVLPFVELEMPDSVDALKQALERKETTQETTGNQTEATQEATGDQTEATGDQPEATQEPTVNVLLKTGIPIPQDDSHIMKDLLSRITDTPPTNLLKDMEERFQQEPDMFKNVIQALENDGEMEAYKELYELLGRMGMKLSNLPTPS
jgi:hypothetical protein